MEEKIKNWILQGQYLFVINYEGIDKDFLIDINQESFLKNENEFVGYTDVFIPILNTHNTPKTVLKNAGLEDDHKSFTEAYTHLFQKSKILNGRPATFEEKAAASRKAHQ